MWKHNESRPTFNRLHSPGLLRVNMYQHVAFTIGVTPCDLTSNQTGLRILTIAIQVGQTDDWSFLDELMRLSG